MNLNDEELGKLVSGDFMSRIDGWGEHEEICFFWLNSAWMVVNTALETFKVHFLFILPRTKLNFTNDLRSKQRPSLNLLILLDPTATC